MECKRWWLTVVIIHPKCKSHPNLGILLVHLVLHRNNKERAFYLYWRFPKDGWRLHLSMPRLLQWRIVFLAVPRLTSWIIASKKEQQCNLHVFAQHNLLVVFRLFLWPLPRKWVFAQFGKSGGKAGFSPESIGVSLERVSPDATSHVSFIGGHLQTLNFHYFK